MADYVSKYTGSQVDGILDEAIELPEATSRDTGKFLKYNGNALEWGPSIDTSNASANEFLKYNGTGNLVWDKPVPDFDSSDLYTALMVVYDSGHPTLKWHDPFDTSDASNGQFLKYSSTSGVIWDTVPGINTTNASNGKFLKYSSTTGIMWDNVPGIDMTGANNGEFLRYNNDGLSWEDPFDTSRATPDDFLKYDEYGNLVWDTPFPRFTSNDDGQVLTVVAGNDDEIYLDWRDSIDTTDASNGQFLKYSSNTGIMWDNAPGINATNAPYNGKYLKYSSTSGIIWDTVPGIDTTNASVGDVLTYGNNGIEWDVPPAPNIMSLLPTGTSGQVLIHGVNSIAWGNYNPFPSGAVSGQCLMYNDGNIEWANASPIPDPPSYGLVLVSSDNGPQWMDPSEVLQ